MSNHVHIIWQVQKGYQSDYFLKNTGKKTVYQLENKLLNKESQSKSENTTMLIELWILCGVEVQ